MLEPAADCHSVLSKTQASDLPHRWSFTFSRASTAQSAIQGLLYLSPPALEFDFPRMLYPSSF